MGKTEILAFVSTNFGDLVAHIRKATKGKEIVSVSHATVANFTYSAMVVVKVPKRKKR